MRERESRELRRLELAVVDAAMREYYAILSTGEEPAVELVSATRQAIKALIYACPECDAGGHTCPGDGEPIGHGATDCGKHDDECQCPRTERVYCHSSKCHGGADVAGQVTDELQRLIGDELLPLWVTRTWADVVVGDTVRLPGTEFVACIDASTRRGWHVDPRTGTSSWNPPVPMEFAVQVVRFAGETVPREMDPAKSIEIKMTRFELNALGVLADGLPFTRVEVRKEGS